MIDKSAIRAVFENSLKLKQDESCLILTDKIKESIAREFFEYAKKICSKCHIEVMEPLSQHGEEPPKKIKDLICLVLIQVLL